MRRLLAVLLMLLLCAPGQASAGAIKHVIVIALENTDAGQIFGNTAQAPYLNNIVKPIAARATAFTDMLGLAVRSEPHYILMQSGKRSFADHTFTTNGDPSATNSTASHAHLIWQLTKSSWAAKPTWMTYQQSLNAATGACPIVSAHPYAAKHNPFVFFQDIAGNPPSKTNAGCAAHHRPYSTFAADLAANRLANYVFITPDMCHDMHDACGASSRIRAGDDWLKAELPPMIAWANANQGVIFIVWDEGNKTLRLPFFAIGPGVKKGFASAVALNHNSFVKSLSLILGVPVLAAAADANTFASLFKAGAFP